MHIRAGLVRLMIASAAIGLGLSSSQAEEISSIRVDGSAYNDWKLSRITPHETFNTPSARRPIKTLFIVPNALAAREVGELQQRMDLDVQVVSTFDEKILGVTKEIDQWSSMLHGTSVQEKEAELLDKLKSKPDVIILANFFFTMLPESAQKEIEAQVRAGTGLVLLYRRDIPEQILVDIRSHPMLEDWERMLNSVAWDLTPDYPGRWRDQPTARQFGTFMLDQGRVAVVDYGEAADGMDSTRFGGMGISAPVPFGYEMPVIYHHLLSLPAKAIAWAGKQNSPVTITQAKAEGTSVSLRVSSDQPRTVQANLLFRDTHGRGRWTETQEISLDAGTNTLSLPLPASALPLARERYVADVWLKQDDKIVDWASASFHPQADLVMESLMTLDPRALTKDQPLQAAIQLKRVLKPSEQAELWLEDSQGRVLQKISGNATGVTVRFEEKLRPDASPMMVRPVFVILEEGKVAERLENEAWDILIQKPIDRKFHMILWGASSAGMPAYQSLQAYQEVGMDTVLGFSSRNRNAMLRRLGLNMVNHSYTLCVGNNADAKKYRNRFKPAHVFPPEAWFVQEDRQLFEKMWREHVKQTSMENSVLAYSWGDEIAIGGSNVGYSEPWLEPFQEDLRARYSSLAELNRNWQTHYQSFEEVKPAKASEVVTAEQVQAKEQQAADKAIKGTAEQFTGSGKTYAPYLDHRRFMERTFVDMLRVNREQIIEKDNRFATLGFEGSGSIESFYGFDIPGIAQTSTAWAPYYCRVTNELIRCFKNDRMVCGNWAGGYVSGRKLGPTMEFTIYDTLLSGANSIWFYVQTTAEGGSNLDLSLASHSNPEMLKQLNGGLGEWLANARIVDDSVAIFYSNESRIVTGFEYPWGHYGNILAAWLQLLNDQGITPRFVIGEQLLAGQITPEKYRVLILPSAVCLSDAEAKAIRQYVSDGGTVIADLRPGVLNEHGLYLEHGQLDDLFGVTRTTTYPKTDMRPFSAKVGDIALNFSNTDVDTTVKLAGGKGGSLGDNTPVAIVNPCGSGKAILLNFNLSPYNKNLEDNRKVMNTAPYLSEGASELIHSYLESAGAVPAIGVTDNEGKLLPRVRKTLFQIGDDRVVGVLRSMKLSTHMDENRQVFVQPWNAKEPDDVALRLTLDKEQQVVEFGAGTPAKTSKVQETTLKHAQARFFVVSNRQMVAPKLKASGARLGGTVVAEITVPKANRVLLRVELLGPDGQAMPDSRKFVWTTDGVAKSNFVIAFNDPAGVYTLSAQDVASGLTSKASVNVKPRKGH